MIVKCCECNKEMEDWKAYQSKYGDYFCQTCYYKRIYKCGCCGGEFDSRVVPKSSKTFGLNQPLCPQCAKYIVRKCSGCGHSHYRFEKDEDGTEYCGACVNEAIHSYHHTKTSFPFFANRGEYNYKSKRGANNDHYFGIELEMDQKQDNIDRNYRLTLLGMKKMLNNEVYFETDCSLGYNGAELITFPHTIPAFYKLNWKDAFRYAIHKKYQSHNSGKCGLHFHFNKAFFGKTEATRIENVAKVLVFYNLFWDDIVKFSRRTENQLSQWANKPYFVEKAENKKKFEEDAKHIARGTNGRYSAVNLNQSGETIEFRAMRGTLNYDTFMATVDFSINIVLKASKLKWDDVYDYTKWLDEVAPNTIEYMKARGCFENLYKDKEEQS